MPGFCWQERFSSSWNSCTTWDRCFQMMVYQCSLCPCKKLHVHIWNLKPPQILCLWLYYFHSSVCFYCDPLPTSKFPFPSRFQCFKSNPQKKFALLTLWRFCIGCFVYICFNLSGFAFVLTFSSKHMLLYSYISTRKTFVIRRNGFRLQLLWAVHYLWCKSLASSPQEKHFC